MKSEGKKSFQKTMYIGSLSLKKDDGEKLSTAVMQVSLKTKRITENLKSEMISMIKDELDLMSLDMGGNKAGDDVVSCIYFSELDTIGVHFSSCPVILTKKMFHGACKRGWVVVNECEQFQKMWSKYQKPK